MTTSLENLASQRLHELESLLRLESEHQISPQLAARLRNLLGSSIQDRSSFTRNLSSLFNRLLLELVQSHYTTKQRENDFIKLVKSKGCTIPPLAGPYLTNEVIRILVTLYKGADRCTDSSFERKVLKEYLLKRIGVTSSGDKREVERSLQTLYRTSCFDTGIGETRRLKLKENLRDVTRLRNHHDEGLIRISLEAKIRLPPERWCHLLSRPNDRSWIQSILDKNQAPVDLEELDVAIKRQKDMHNMSPYLPELQKINDLIDHLMGGENSKILPEDIVDVLDRLIRIGHLFSLRQKRQAVGSREIS